MVQQNKLPTQDYLDIQNLYALYNLASDATDSTTYANCFTDDGVLEAATIGISVSGRDALIAHKERDKANRGGKYRRHWNGRLYLERQSNGSVLGRCYLVAYNGLPGELPVLADCGVYEDTLVQTNGEWNFSRRILTMAGASWGQSDDS